MFRIYFFDGVKGFVSLFLGSLFFCQIGILAVGSPYLTPIIVIFFPYFLFLYNAYLGFYQKTVVTFILWTLILFLFIYITGYFKLYVLEESVYNPDKVFFNPAFRALPFLEILQERILQFLFVLITSFVTIGFVTAGFIYFEIINTVYNVFSVLEKARAPFIYYIAAFPVYHLFYWLSYAMFAAAGLYTMFTKVLKRELENAPVFKTLIFAFFVFLTGIIIEFLTKDFYFEVLRDLTLK